MKARFLCLFLILFFSYSASASAMTTISGRPAPGGAGNTNYCNDANAQLCLFMNGNGTDETDRTANGYTITDSTSSPATSSTVPSGYSGTSRNFVATSKQLLNCSEANCPNLDISGTGAKLTIMAWINLASVPASGVQYGITQKYSSYNNQRQYQLFLNGTGSSQFKVGGTISTNGSTANVLYTTTTTYAGSTWYHVALVYNGTDMRLYVNGSLDCTPLNLSGGIYNGSSEFRVGVESNSSDQYVCYFNGLIDEVAVFNRDLSSTEIADIYANGLTGNKGGND